MHGASLSSLLHNAKSYATTLLVVKDQQGVVFGALITETLKLHEKDKFYGNGNIGVWSFATGSLKVSGCWWFVGLLCLQFTAQLTVIATVLSMELQKLLSHVNNERLPGLWRGWALRTLFGCGSKLWQQWRMRNLRFTLSVIE
jgi:hypothetical protein